MKNITFSKALLYYFIFYTVTLFINGFTVQNSFLVSLCRASFGFYLLVNPIYPNSFEYHYGREKSRKYIRIIAVILIVSSFMIKTNF